MAHQSPIRNPFMMMLNPEVVLAAIENSEHLSQLNRHLCRPLDRPAVTNVQPGPDVSVEDDDTDPADDPLDQ